MAEGEFYSHQGSATFEAELGKRTASQDAAFLLPHLRAGMRVLDAGCGPGSITLGLATAVAPGEVVGIDAQPSLVEQARALAVQRSVTNVRFEVADVYDLPFPDGSFDAAFANTVLQHLREPVQALAELIRRLLKHPADCARLGHAARATVSQMFCIDHNLETLVQLLWKTAKISLPEQSTSPMIEREFDYA